MSRQRHFTLSEDDRRVLSRWADGGEPGVLRQRARIVLCADAGADVSETARLLRTTRTTVTTWRARFAEAGLAGLGDQPRAGRSRAVHDVDVVRATLTERPPDGPVWSSRSLGRHLEVSNGTVARVWRRWRLDPRRPGDARLGSAPELPGPVHDLVGLYADPAVQIIAVRLRTGGSVVRLRPVEPVAGDDPGQHRLWRFCAQMQRCGSGAGTAVHLIRFDGRPDPVRDEVRDRLAGLPALRLHVPVPGVTWADAVQVIRVVLTAGNGTAESAAA